MRQDRLRPLLLLLCGLALLLSASPRCAAAAEFAESFEGGKPTWSVDDAAGMTLRSHLRRGDVQAPEGSRAEVLSLVSSKAGGTVLLSHPLRPSRVIPELTLSLWIRSNRPGAAVWLRVLFPHEIDPDTGRTLDVLIQGETCTTAGKWQQVRCVTTDKLIQHQIILQRARLKNAKLNYRDLYVDRVYVDFPVNVGTTDIMLDGLHFGPIVDLRPEAPVAQVGLETAEPAVSVELRGGRLQLDGHPFFPRITPTHGESLETLKKAGMNVILVPDYEDVALLTEIRRQGMWAMAEPPCVISETGKVLDAKSAGIVPFSEYTSPILMWYMGTLIPAEMRPKVVAWTEQVRHADRRIRRPVAADVAELEQVYSRQFDLVCSSRHFLNTTFTFKDYRDWLVQKRQLANPWTYLWTWIQTEPVGANSQWRAEDGKSPIVIEPEQLRLQTYAALSAGCRAIGFWKRTSLDEHAPGAQERRLTLQMLDLELELLEPWLATGVVSEIVPFSVPVPIDPSVGRKTIEAEHRTGGLRAIKHALVTRQSELDRIQLTNTELEAAIIKSHLGTLALPVWYENGAQFVPGKMAAYDATIVVPGAEPSAHAWEVTPTGIHTVEKSERVPGGKKIVLKKFDQTAAVIFTSDVHIREMLEEKIREIAPAYARAGLELAKAKLARVLAVDALLQDLSTNQIEGKLLDLAQQCIERSEIYLERAEFDAARQQNVDAMRMIRIVQHEHWENATFKMSSPISSPYTVSFQTLPDHWRMIARLGRSEANASDNLIPSGDFENEESVVADWHHSQNQVEGIRAAAELYPVAHKGSYSLRLVAVPDTGVDVPAVVGRSPVTVIAPPVRVTSGQLVHIGGWVRVASPVSGSLDGVMLYDNLTGNVGALRWRNAADWQWFDMVREVRETGELSLTMSLQGIGEVQFDDLQIVPVDETRQAAGTKDARNGRTDLLHFLNPFPTRRVRSDETRPAAKNTR